MMEKGPWSCGSIEHSRQGGQNLMTLMGKGPWSCGSMEHSGQGGQNLMTLNKCHLLYRYHLFNW
ncbi:hypothetical protein DPMN_134126 [Dreissena polymorpha]|uniref:Uncharacterized protein n=1 Tax=Dreissena polymorpha TaxID=45954 RepID=A0A9D4G1G6_DREPO|nr:hypothetical protein DPMN_134126 [Dreissena polymorpha]